MPLFRMRRILSITVAATGLLGACTSEGELFTPKPGPIIEPPVLPEAPIVETCTGTPPDGQWSHVITSASLGNGASTIDAAGNLIFVGTFKGTLQAGSSPTLSAVSAYNIEVLKLDPSGKFLWSTRLGGDTSNLTSQGVGVDGAGNIYLAGSFDGTFTLGGTTLSSAKPLSGTDAFLAKLDPSGAPLWSKSFVDNANRGIAALTVTPSGRATITGCLLGSMSFGGSPVSNPYDSCATYLASFDADGAPLFSKAFIATVGLGNQDRWQLASDAVGTTYLTETFFGGPDLGGGALVGPSTELPGSVVAAFGPTGSLLWSRTALGVGNIFGVAVASSGDVLVAGQSAPEGVARNEAYTDVALVRLDSSGTVLHTSQWPQTGGWLVDHTLHVGTVGNDAILAGNFYNAFNFGCGGVLDGTGSGAFAYGAIFVARFDATGTTVLSTRFGSPADHGLEGFAVDAAGDVAMSGVFRDTLDLGSGLLTQPSGKAAGFLAKLHL